VAAAVLRGCNTKELLKEYFSVMGRRFGIFFEVFPYGKRMHETRDLDSFLDSAIEDMKEDGWLIQDGNKFELTERGESEARKMLAEIQIAADFWKKQQEPKQSRE
jgi:hypothetical protein